MALKLDVEKKAAMFRKLASASTYDVGVSFGLDKHYKDAKAVRNKVHQVYLEVLRNPDAFAIHPDTVSLVEEAVSTRKIAVRPAATLAEKNQAITDVDIKGLTISSRDRAGRLINKKLEYIEQHPKALMNESLVTLGKIFGILFDKAQIIQGQATEHVAVMSKIGADMTPEEALNSVMRMREVVQADKHD